MRRIASSVMLLAGAVMLMGAADRARVNPLTDQAAAAEAGAHLYANECSKCHGVSAEGKGSRPALVSDRVAHATDGELAWMLRNGNPWKGMPSWSVLPDAQRWQLVAYLRKINGAGAAGEKQGEIK
jgi:mono/diheme cytochrome c family protein